VVWIFIAFATGIADDPVCRCQNERSLDAPAVPHDGLGCPGELSAICIVHNSASNTAEPISRWRAVVDQVPNGILHVPPIHDLAAADLCPDIVLVHDPLCKLHVPRVLNDASIFKLIPIVDDGSVVPPARPNLRLLVETPCAESIPIQRIVTLEFQPE
jgi:hypothetical protein